jgi:uncharacterized membrane protein
MTSVAQVSAPRYVLIDVLRAAALVLMVAFHFCFDLSYFGLANLDFYQDPFWLNARIFILGSFLGLVGVGLWLAHSTEVPIGRAGKRIGIIACNAVLVSVATYLMFGERWIFFGVLHFIAAASLLGLLLVRSMPLALGAGMLCLWGGQYADPLFDQPGLRWIGFMTHKPATEDYVPLIPWFGVVALGIVAAPMLKMVGAAWRPRGRGWRAVSTAGRHTLLIYMLHQPLLIGAIKLFVAVTTASSPMN